MNYTSRRRCLSIKTLVSVLISLLIGLSITFYKCILLPALRTDAISGTKSTSTDGWHPIHVFYGNRNALLGGTNHSNATWFSQVRQDEIVIDLLGDIGSAGFFIDLAANDAWDLSNTLALEKRGWNGLCIEPNPNYWFGLSHRKCTVVGALLGGQIEQVNVSFRGAYGGIVELMSHRLAKRMKAPAAPTETRYTVPLIDVFERFHVPNVVDYMSLDVEGAEYLIMKDFPFDKYRIKLLTVERPNNELKAILGHHGYVYLKLLVPFGETLWAHNSTGITPDHPKVKKIVMQPS